MTRKKSARSRPPKAGARGASRSTRSDTSPPTPNGVQHPGPAEAGNKASVHPPSQPAASNTESTVPDRDQASPSKLFASLRAKFQESDLAGAAEAANGYVMAGAGIDDDFAQRSEYARQVCFVFSEKEAGTEAFKKGKWERAVTAYTNALKAAKAARASEAVQGSLHFNVGMSHLKLKRYTSAITSFSECLQNRGPRVKALRNRAVAYENRRNYHDAAHDLAEALDLVKQGQGVDFRSVLEQDSTRVEGKLEQERRRRYRPAVEDDPFDYFFSDFHFFFFHRFMHDNPFFAAQRARNVASVTNDQHYETLGLEPGATEVEIRTAFKALALQHHPDKGGDAEKFKEVRHAYSVLIGDD
ncbi:hypothetical protein JCM3774_005290 [Rhodotorula dairenensis]